MCTSAGVKHFKTRPQVEMVCIVEDQRNAECFDLFWSQALDSRLSCDGHECREHCNTILWSAGQQEQLNARGSVRGKVNLETRAFVVWHFEMTWNCIASGKDTRNCD